MDSFLEKAYNKHGNKYDYSHVLYTECKVKICINCEKPGHGFFWKTPDSHIQGSGCNKCSKEEREEKEKGIQQEKFEKFIQEANKKHEEYGFEYPSSLDFPFSMDTPITIRCKTHGYFEQTPRSHLKCAFPCKRCVKVTNTEDFIKVVSLLYNSNGPKYDYSQTDYQKSGLHVTVICNIHGPFSINANNHIRGWGCSRCSVHDKEKNQMDILLQTQTKQSILSSSSDSSNSSLSSSSSSSSSSFDNNTINKSIPYSFISGRIEFLSFFYVSFALNQLLYSEKILEEDIIIKKDCFPLVLQSFEFDIFLPKQQKCIEVILVWNNKQKDKENEKEKEFTEIGYTYELWQYNANGKRILNNEEEADDESYEYEAYEEEEEVEEESDEEEDRNISLSIMEI